MKTRKKENVFLDNSCIHCFWKEKWHFRIYSFPTQNIWIKIGVQVTKPTYKKYLISLYVTEVYETINFNITEVSHPIHVLFPIIYFEDNPTSVNAVNMSHIYHTTNFRFRCRRHHKLLYFVSDLNHSITYHGCCI